MLVKMPAPYTQNGELMRYRATSSLSNKETYYRTGPTAPHHPFHHVQWRCGACNEFMELILEYHRELDEHHYVLNCADPSCAQQGYRFVEINGDFHPEYPAPGENADTEEEPVELKIPRICPSHGKMEAFFSQDTGELDHRSKKKPTVVLAWNQCTWRCSACGNALSRGKDYLVCRRKGCAQCNVEFPIRLGLPCLQKENSVKPVPENVEVCTCRKIEPTEGVHCDAR